MLVLVRKYVLNWYLEKIFHSTNVEEREIYNASSCPALWVLRERAGSLEMSLPALCQFAFLHLICLLTSNLTQSCLTEDDREQWFLKYGPWTNLSCECAGNANS